VPHQRFACGISKDRAAAIIEEIYAAGQKNKAQTPASAPVAAPAPASPVSPDSPKP